ncbi:PIN domain-containing protein, partial [Staphylococcus capitis]|nr:PIN domain-containing protein [Staphylococcus capitis]
MIPVDTNVMPEPLRREPNAAVIEWLDAQNVETLYLAAISLAELRFGVAALPEGRRRDWLQQSIGQ